jgi:enamine deaminase RidA (YjgF/YER057c/UK114 family)
MDKGRQFALALSNAVIVIEAAGGKLEHLVNLRIYVAAVDAFNAAGKAVSASPFLGRSGEAV